MRRFAVYFLLANAIGGFFLWLAARDLPIEQIGRYVGRTDHAHLALWSAIFVGVYVVCHGARIVRWLFLVRPLDEDLDAGTVFRVGTVGFTAILLLPLRLGELVRPYLLARRTDLSISGVLGTAVVERVIDGLLMTGLLFVTLATYGGDRATAFATSAGYIAAAIFIPALAVCILALWRRDLALTLVQRLVAPISDKLSGQLTGLLDDFINGFRGLLEADNLVSYLALTGLYWITNVVSLWFLARFGFGLELTPWQMATVLPILVIGIMIPAGPALAGNFEYFIIRGLGLFVAVDMADIGTRAAVFAALVHVLQFVVITVPGFWVMWTDREARHLIALSRRAEEAVPDQAAAHQRE